MEKTYVAVSCIHLANGAVLPKALRTDDGRVLTITRVIHSCEAAHDEFEGIRYTVLIGSAEVYLYQVGSRWYVLSG